MKKTLCTLAIAATALATAQAADTASKAGNSVATAASGTEHAVGKAAHKTGEVATDAAHGAQHGMQKAGGAIAPQIDKADKAMHGKSGKSAVADVKAQSDAPSGSKPTASAKAASQAK